MSSHGKPISSPSFSMSPRVQTQVLVPGSLARADIFCIVIPCHWRNNNYILYQHDNICFGGALCAFFGYVTHFHRTCLSSLECTTEWFIRKYRCINCEVCGNRTCKNMRPPTDRSRQKLKVNRARSFTKQVANHHLVGQWLNMVRGHVKSWNRNRFSNECQPLSIAMSRFLGGTFLGAQPSLDYRKWQRVSRLQWLFLVSRTIHVESTSGHSTKQAEL